MLSCPLVVSRPRLFQYFIWLFLPGLPCLAAEVPGATALSTKPAAESYAQSKLAFWKGRLKLDAWSVIVTIASPNDLRPGTLGNIHWDPDKKTAVIRILDNAGTPDDLSNMECTIVHELIHLQLAALPRTDESRIAEEAAVNNIADALLQLEREDSAANK